MTLPELLHPLTVSDFLVEHFGIHPVCVEGPVGRFAGAQMDGPCPFVAALCRDLELTLEAPVRYQHQTDWRGHKSHRREQDSFVLQTAGRATWSLSGKALTPSEQPTWQGTLEDGGVLYLPKGWWCTAVAQQPMSSILVLSIDNPTGADLLDWLVGQLSAHEIVCADIPRFGTPAAKADYLIAMRGLLGQIFQSPGLLETYARQMDAAASGSGASSSGLAWREDLPGDYQIVLASRRYPRVRRLNGAAIYLSVTGRALPFPMNTAPLIIYLLDKMPISLARFYHEFENEFDRTALSDLLGVLSANGIVAFAAPDRVT